MARYAQNVPLMVQTFQELAMLVDVGERIDGAMHDGRLNEGTSRKVPNRKEKDVEIAYVQAPVATKPLASSSQGPSVFRERAYQNHDFKRRAPREFTPLPRPLSKLLPMLLRMGMIAKEVARDNPPRFPGFDLSKSCEFHRGEKGHDVDNCFTLKIKVQNLLDKETNEPTNEGVSESLIVTDSEGENLYDDLGPQASNVDWNREFIKLAHENGEVVDTLGQPSGKFDYLVKYSRPPSFFIDPKDVVPDGWGGMDDPPEPEEETVNMITPVVIDLSVEEDLSDPDERDVEHVVIDVMAEEFTTLEVDDHVMEPMTIELSPEDEDDIIVEMVPSYNAKAVPWSYKVSEIDDVTRSGRCYDPTKVVEKRAVSNEEAEQFLAIIKTSEFDVVNQLRKMPAQISLMDLFKSSKKHKNALFKILNEVHVPETINDTQLEEFVGSILLKDQISFADEDFPPGGRNHTKALFISVKCRDRMVARVLIDNGSALNICPLATLRRLGVNEKKMLVSKSTVRAFDGMKKEVIGEVELELLIGPVLFLVSFQVLDIPSAFNFLLERPWIHTARAVPSSLHQKVKFIIDGKLVTIHGETDFKVFHDTAIPYVEPENKAESSYQTLDLVSMVHVPVGTIMRDLEMAKSSIMSSKVLLENGHVPGTGLGLHGQVIKKPLQVSKWRKRIGLGYHGDDSGGRDNHGGRGSVGGRGQHGGRGGRGGHANYDGHANYSWPWFFQQIFDGIILSYEQDPMMECVLA
ncbi:uncharacterized protein LOC115665583 [Syzygium oleosum]|uniref:uncharacterized protein LOC115665583 n=1 Tax=Syzygium oleosum TaxID=219896 RepID=UPI0024B959E8|nr:uncharacterized protein LOC115665583 [Syzygium oleosum]